jgi:hypothetical protein
MVAQYQRCAYERAPSAVHKGSRKWGRSGFAVAGLVVAATVAIPAQAAFAATMAVACSKSALVNAIMTANTTPGPDTLNLFPGCPYTLTSPNNLGNGLPVITSNITINGNGATIKRAPTAANFRILEVGTSGTLTLNRATISGGAAIDCPGAGGPVAAAICGGGIYNRGTLTVNNSRVIRNTASGTATFLYIEGGGIANDGNGTATLNDTEVSNNTARYTGTGGPGLPAGGGIGSEGVLTVNRSRVSNNAASLTPNTGSEARGAVAVLWGSATIKSSIINNNTTTAPGGIARGGGMSIGVSVNVTMAGNLLTNNTASAPDGFALGGGLRNNGTLDMTTTAVTGNTASAPRGTALGGGIYNEFDGTATLTTSAVVGNRATGGSAAGGGIFNDGGPVTLNNTVVLGNIPDNCQPPGTVSGCTDSLGLSTTSAAPAQSRTAAAG